MKDHLMVKAVGLYTFIHRIKPTQGLLSLDFWQRDTYFSPAKCPNLVDLTQRAEITRE